MADIDVLSADLTDGRITRLQVRIKNADTRTIDRAAALAWLREGHSLVPVAGHGHHVHRGGALLTLELDGEEYIRTDTRREASDSVHFPTH